MRRLASNKLTGRPIDQVPVFIFLSGSIAAHYQELTAVLQGWLQEMPILFLSRKDFQFTAFISRFIALLSAGSAYTCLDFIPDSSSMCFNQVTTGRNKLNSRLLMLLYQKCNGNRWNLKNVHFSSKQTDVSSTSKQVIWLSGEVKNTSTVCFTWNDIKHLNWI